LFQSSKQKFSKIFSLIRFLIAAIFSSAIMQQQENGSSAPSTPLLSEQQQQPWGAGRTQEALMESDTVLVLGRHDQIIGSASKKESHILTKNHPHGILHRAFSVFLFDESDGRLLIHQRAHSKITFPDVREVQTGMSKVSAFFFLLTHFFLLFRIQGLDQHLLLASIARNDSFRIRIGRSIGENYQ
jgi:hypothetical protein